MALSKSSLKQRIIQELESQGFVTRGQYARSAQMAEAIANAVVDEITENAKVPVTGGSSSGTYHVR
ncbi:hypothetical protein ACB087_01315 [Vibrio sp. VNB-15]